MWIVKLAVPTTVKDVLRYPSEGELTVTEAEAERLYVNGLLDGEPRPFPGEGGEGDDEDGEGGDASELSKLTIPDLRRLAETENVDLTDLTKKAEIVAAILKHREGASGE